MSSKSVSMTLRRIDRCDVCGAQALVLTVFASGRLMFCGHHFAKHEAELVWQALEVLDYREKSR